MINYME